jgi:transposase
MEGMGEKPRRRRAFTAEFKAEIVELCQPGDRSVGQVAKDFDLTETVVREWVRQAERDAGTGDGGLTLAEAVERAVSRHRGYLAAAVQSPWPPIGSAPRAGPAGAAENGAGRQPDPGPAR